MINWTKEQEDAIYTEGSDILVAAAAGSGKTAVLVERIIQKLLSTKDPVDIDSLLVVTFTNAAAQEMRNRVGQALEQALAAHPTSHHLKKQLSLLQRAPISTLHSFCMDVVKEHAYLLDIDPAFRIANDMEADLMKQDVIDDLFEEWYGQEGEKQERFFAVVDRFSNDRSDQEVENLILQLYTFARQHPWPQEWLDELFQVYHVPEQYDESTLHWLDVLKDDVNMQFDAIEQEMQMALTTAQENDGPYHYLDAIESDLANLEQAREQKSWDELQLFMEKSTFKRLSGKRVDCDEVKRDQVRKWRDRYRKRWNDMKRSFFIRNLKSHLEDMRELAPVIRELTALVKQFGEQFAQLKREKGLVDFSDLEHFCLQLLVDESSTPEQIIPSHVAQHYQKKFSEILIDEYQDTNLVQETILKLLSDQSGSGNMFMVGDVKQSIYRFRHAEPSLFIQKYHAFAQEDHPAKRIDLASNFRSREHVLLATNYIFRQILDEKLGDIKYDEDAELIYANDTYDSLPLSESKPELLLIDHDPEESNDDVEDSENYQDLETAQLEARAYVKKINDWVGSESSPPLKIVDKSTNVQRNVQYRDIVILLRSMTWAPTIVDELKKNGIPVYAELSTGYFEAIEVKVMLSLLKVIDNPHQDIPLASVLRSPIVGLDEEELTRIRLADRHRSYYDALKSFKDEDSSTTATKVEMFLNQLQTFRFAARQGALSELIWHIYRETGYYDFVGGMPGGRQRQANLRALYDRARGYETTSFRGLFRFLRFIERMEERGDDLGAARALSEQEDVVRIMTIHSSKGLEFPVVIVGGLARGFNLQDLNQKYMLHKDLGFASKYIDPIQRITYPTLFYHAIRKEKLREQLAEEMRVLYVALTRAKEKLVMIGSVREFEKEANKWVELLDHPEWIYPTSVRAEARSYLEWVGPALIRHEANEALRQGEDISASVGEDIRYDSSEWDVSIIHAQQLMHIDGDIQDERDKELQDHIFHWQPFELEETSLEQQVDERLSFRYPYIEATHSRAKQTVTEIKRQREIKDEYSSDQMIQPFRSRIVKRPQFMQKEQTITAAEVGTAMHTVMQHLPMTERLSTADIKEHLESFVDREILTREERDIIDIHAVERFYDTTIAQYMMNQSTIYREVPFSLSLPASEVYTSWSGKRDEPVLIQGVIDCLIPHEDGWMILDYKTDAIDEEVTQEVKDKLIQRYNVQMNLYKTAIESIWNEPVKDIYLYFFAKSLIIQVPFTHLYQH